MVIMDTMNMNIDTLLEAAIFLEKRSGSQGWTSAKARAKAVSFHPYAKSPSKAPLPDDPNGSEGDAADLELSPGEDGKDRRRAGGAGTREVHNKLEKNRRAHLKECFEQLKRQIPSLEDKRTSNLSILRCALRYIQMLKRKDKELEVEMISVSKEKLRTQDRIARLKRELVAMNIDIDVGAIVSSAATCKEEDDTASDSTATADNESPIVSEAEGDDVDEDDGPKIPIKHEAETEVDRKPHVPVTATLPAIQTPAMTVSLATAPKPLAVSASTSIVIAPQNQAMTHAVLAMPSARALSNVSKVITAPNQPIVALQADATTMPLPSGMVPGTVPARMQAPGNTASPIATPMVQSQTVPATATFKTPVAQILHQTIAQRALAQHLQQHQVRLQQQQQQPQPQPQQNHPSTPQGAKVFTVQGGTLRHNLQSLTQLRQAVTMNHLVPSLLTPGTSILAAPSTLTPAQIAPLTTVGKVADPSVTAVVVSASSAAAFTTTTNTVSSTQALSPAVTFTTMKQFLTPQQLPTHIMSLSSSHMSTIGQLISQGVQRGAATVQPHGMALAPPQGAGGATTVTMAGMTPVTSATMVTLPSTNNTAQQQHPVMASLTHMAPAGAQIVAPLSLVTSQAGLNPGSLSQAQLNLVNSPILRSLGHIPIQLQQPFGLGQLVKPVVMVSVPSVATTSSQPTTVQVQLPVTHTS